MSTKTLRVTLADIHAATGVGESSATVLARYVDTRQRGRDVHLTDGTIVVPVRRAVDAAGTPEHFDFTVYPSDDPAVREVDRGFLVEVSWKVTAPEGGTSSGVRRVLVTDDMDAVVSLGLLATPAPIPPYSGGYATPETVAAMQAEIDALADPASFATAAQGAKADAAAARPVPNRGTARIAAKLRAGKATTVAFLGDSGLEGTTTTIPGTDDAASLVTSGLASAYGVTVTKQNLAISGYRAYSILNPGELATTKFATALGLRADLYVFSFGHNDIRSDDTSPTYRPNTGYPLAASVAALEHAIRRLRVEVPGADIVVSNSWPYTGPSFASNTLLTPHGNALRELAASYGCAFVDFTAALAAVGVTGTTPATDDLYIHPTGEAGAQHPNGGGHRVWADAILATVAAGDTATAPTPTVPPRPIHGAERYTNAGLVAMPAAGARTYGSDGYRFIGTWAGAATLPQTSSTAAEAIDIQFIGTECFLRLDTGAGQGHVKINVDGVNFNADLNLGALGTGQSRLPITGLSMGTHRVLVTIISGSLTFRGVEYLPAMVRRMPHTSGLITYTGAGWSTIGVAAEFYDTGRHNNTTLGDSYTVQFIGTGLAVNGAHYGATTYSVKVSVDGAADVTQDWATGGDGTLPATSRVVVSGLAYGRHTVRVTLNQAARAIAVATLCAFDETRTERPSTLHGLAVAAEAITHPQPLPSVPSVVATPDDATSVLPPYPSSNTAAGITLTGTASARIAYRLETGRVAW